MRALGFVIIVGDKTPWRFCISSCKCHDMTKIDKFVAKRYFNWTDDEINSAKGQLHKLCNYELHKHNKFHKKTQINATPIGSIHVSLGVNKASANEHFTTTMTHSTTAKYHYALSDF